MTGEAIAFPTSMTRALRRRGLKGKVAGLHLEPGGLAVAGDEGGTWRVPFSTVQRMRVGFAETKWGTVLLLRLWTRDTPDGLEVGGNLNRQAYGRFVRAAAAAMLRPERAIPVETGTGLFTPIFAIGAFGLMALGLIGFTIYLLVTGEEDWWMPLPALAIPMILLAVIGPWTISRYAPRRIARVEELEKVLPGCGPP